MARPKGKKSKRNSAPESIIDEPYIEEDGNFQRTAGFMTADREAD